MRGKTMLYLDQWGGAYYAKTVKELKNKVGQGKVSRMYTEMKDGKSFHTGYVIGRHWCRAHTPWLGERVQ